MQHIKEKSTLYTQNTIYNTSVMEMKLISHYLECPIPEFWISVQNEKKILNKKAVGTSYLCDYGLSTDVATKSKNRLKLNTE